MKNVGFFLLVVFLVVGCSSAPKKSISKNPLLGQSVDALCSVDGIPVSEVGAIFMGSGNGYYILKTEDGPIVTLPVNSCILQITPPVKPHFKPSGSPAFPI